MNRTLVTLLIGLLIVSCTSKPRDTSKVSETTVLTKKEMYEFLMKKKKFQLKINGPCDDALEDKIHQRSTAYFDSKTLNDKNAIIEFKFIDACCKEFLGDYKIENDTLKFKFEQVNDEVCRCLCWYRYKLTINEPKENYKEIIIEEK